MRLIKQIKLMKREKIQLHITYLNCGKYKIYNTDIRSPLLKCIVIERDIGNYPSSFFYVLSHTYENCNAQVT